MRTLAVFIRSQLFIATSLFPYSGWFVVLVNAVKLFEKMCSIQVLNPASESTESNSVSVCQV